MKKPVLLCLVLAAIYSETSFADVRRSKFRTNNNLTKYVALGGNYSSDFNSKEYKLSTGYQYSKNNLMSEFDFLQHTRYTSSSTHSLEKNRELYDFEASVKSLIADSSNYFNFYNRSKYDEFSDYYYDINNVAGWGRLFFDGIIEADINAGYNEIKNFESHIVINPNIKVNLWLTEKIRMSVKALIFKVQDQYSEELKTRFSYRLNRNLSFDIYHNFERKRFLKSTSGGDSTQNQVQRDLIFRVRYNF